MAGVGPGDIDYVGLYDSFTITVLEQLEDLGFCEKGKGDRLSSRGRCEVRTVRCRPTAMSADSATTTLVLAAACRR
jgi:ribosomal protein S19E (S16A)